MRKMRKMGKMRDVSKEELKVDLPQNFSLKEEKNDYGEDFVHLFYKDTSITKFASTKAAPENIRKSALKYLERQEKDNRGYVR